MTAPAAGDPAPKRRGAAGAPVRRTAALVAFCFVLPTAPAAAKRGRSAGAFTVELVARSFTRALLAGRIDEALALCDRRVSFDGQPATRKAEIRRRLRAIARRSRRAHLRLGRLELSTPHEMKKRFGPPPDKLGRAVRRVSRFALVHLGRSGAVLGLRRSRGFWRVALITD